MKDSKNQNPLLRVVKYIRVSTDRQAKVGDSLREQEDTLTEHIDRHDNMICVGTFIDDGISGQKLDRDDFKLLLKKVQNNEVDLIIFSKLDRWFRSLRHYLNTQATLEKLNVSWTAVSQPFFDTATAHGRAFVSQSMAWAELEAQNGSERILAVFNNKVKNGEVISGTVPLGYSIVNKRLVPNEDAEKVVKIYEQYLKEPNLRELMRFANSEFGLFRGHAVFKHLIQNTKYKGEFRGNKNYCPPLVSVELWEECNRLVMRNQRSNKTHEYVFSALIVCADCGKKMSANTMKKRKNGKFLDAVTGEDGYTKYRYPAYRCQRKTNGYPCVATKMFYEKTLETRLLERIKDDLQKYVATYEVKLAPVINNEAKKRTLEKKMVKLKELYLNELIDLEEFKRDKAELQEQLLQLPSSTIERKDLSAVYKVLEMDLDEMYWSMNTKEKNRFWRSFIDVIKLDNDRNMEIIFL